MALPILFKMYFRNSVHITNPGDYKISKSKDLVSWKNKLSVPTETL